MFSFSLQINRRDMIQRVQTLFLIGVVICMALAVEFPIWEKTSPDSEVKYALDAFYWKEFQKNDSDSKAWDLAISRPSFYLAGVGILVCLSTLFSIFQFKRRTTQIKIGALNAFLMMVYIALATYFIYRGESKIGMDARGIFKAGYFFPLGAMILNSLANRFIKKDEDLVRSVDRIR